MVQKIVPVVDTTDRSDNRIVYWDDTASVHKYKDESSGSGSISASNDTLASDVSVTTDSTWTDVCSLSLAAGTYILLAVATAKKSTGTGGGRITARISDGTNHYASTEANLTGSPTEVCLPLPPAKVTIASTTTVKLQVATGTGFDADVLAAINVNGSGNNATQLTAIKIA